MAGPTKQQEFLDALKDPVAASIKRACDEINKRNYRHGLRAISVLYMKEYKAHVVIALADNPDVLETSKSQFIWFFKKAIPDSTVRVSSRASSEPDDNGQYDIHYFISVGPVKHRHPVTLSYNCKTIIDVPYYYCPYIPSTFYSE